MVANPFLHAEKRNLIPFRAEAKGGQVTVSNSNCNVILAQVVACVGFMNNPLPLRISLKTEENFRKYNKTM
jgi:hypothetical protein